MAIIVSRHVKIRGLNITRKVRKYRSSGGKINMKEINQEGINSKSEPQNKIGKTK